jgi:hypothetical protein
MPTFGLNPQTPKPPGGMGYDQSNGSTLKSNGGPVQTPGNNLVNPGYGEQAFELTQNQYLNDPYAAQMSGLATSAGQAGNAENHLVGNLGTLSGPGQGDQYWNQVQGQFQDPYAGEQFARDATQNFQAQGPASAFYDQSMGQYDQLTGYQGPQNTQGQYGQSSAELAGGTQGEQGLGQIAGGYGEKGTYSGQNHAQGQYQQNAASGPMAAQSFYDQVGGSYNQMGQYSDPNLAAGQYAQTQQSFGAMPTVNSADPFYDRAIQLGTQKYNSQAAGRGVYGSSDALSGVGNIITDLNAQRAQNQFGNEMSIAQENRARQQLLGEQARMGDLSSLSAFGANLSGLETYGNLANQAGNQTIQQQTMLGNQARDADVSATDAFNQNLQGASTYANINNQLATQALDRHELLGNLANSADSQALGAQNANIAGVQAFGNIANNADTAETNRYEASTTAMNNADKTGLDRVKTGADIAFGVDDGNREDFTADSTAAYNAANVRDNRKNTAANIANMGSDNDLARLDSFNNAAGSAEGQRQSRLINSIAATRNYSNDVMGALTSGFKSAAAGEYASFEDWFEAEMASSMQEAGLDQQDKEAFRQDAKEIYSQATKKDGG